MLGGVPQEGETHMRPLKASSQAVFGQHGRGLFRRRGDDARRTLEKYTRKVFPSASGLAYNPLFKTIVDTADVGTRVFFSQFRPLPPNHLRIRVGVGNRIFFNQSFFVWAALPWWLYALNAGWCRLDSTIVDIGCGFGGLRRHHIMTASVRTRRSRPSSSPDPGS